MAPGPADVDITVTVDGVLIGAGITGEARPPTELDDGSAVMWDERVAFQVNLCCFSCKSAVVRATMIDAADREYRGAVKVLLVRDWSGCPDQYVCCSDPGSCPEGLEPQLCSP